MATSLSSSIHEYGMFFFVLAQISKDELWGGATKPSIKILYTNR